MYVAVMLLCKLYQMSLGIRKPTILFLTRSNTNRPVELQNEARSLKFRIEEEGPCNENKGADQLCSFCTADLRH